MESETQELKEEVVDLKDHRGRQYKVFTQNFYIMRSALRYFSVKQGLSFTSTKVADNFPLTASVAGSCLSILDDLDIIETRTDSKSQKRYMPQKTDLEKLEKVREILVENLEIQEFK